MDETIRWTVSELTTYVKQMFELDPRLSHTEVVGEVSNLRVPSSGHAYFTLKDSGAALRCVMWANTYRRTNDFNNGDKVIARGSLSVYERDGQYQLYCTSIKAAGVGDLHAQFEALKAKLLAEGLFDEEQKRPLPDYLEDVGIITSPSTAALQDVLNILERRNPLIRPILAPASVQGDHAPLQIIDALARLESYAVEHPLDAVLIVRGGGSYEDLWCFNDEGLARAIAHTSRYLPVISGVGHEIDFTLADFAASLRAPTPSAAAELATPITQNERWAALEAARARADALFERYIMDSRQQLDRLGLQLDRLAPDVRATHQQLDALWQRIERATTTELTLKRSELAALTANLKGVNPQGTLERGYAILYGPDGNVIPGIDDVNEGDTLHIHLADGIIDATANATRSDDHE